MKNENKQCYIINDVGRFYFIKEPNGICDDFENLAEAFKILEQLKSLGMCNLDFFQMFRTATEWWIKPNATKLYENIESALSRMLVTINMVLPSDTLKNAAVGNSLYLLSCVPFSKVDFSNCLRTEPIDVDNFTLYYNTDENGRELLRALWG